MVRIAKIPTYRPFQLKLKILGFFSATFAILIFGRAFHLQIVGDPRLEKLEKSQFQSRLLIQPRRGLITDRNGEHLAVNLEIQSLAANPNKIDQPDKWIFGLSKITGLSYREVSKKLKSKKEFVWIKRHLSADAKESFRKNGLLQKNGSLPEGFWLVQESERVYPHNEIAAQVVGDVNVDLEGIDGVEYWLNEHLRGKMGTVNTIRDALGRPAFIQGNNEQKTEDGKPVSLTLDTPLQFAVERALKSAVDSHSALGGTVIVMDADNGDILAMASQPTLDSERRLRDPARRRNRSLTDGYEPGSTMKPILYAAALEKGWNPKRLIWAEEGKMQVQGKWISEAESHEKFRWLTASQIVQVSSNVGAAKLALEVGAAQYTRVLRKFGFGARTEIGFPGEISGTVPRVDKIKPLNLATMGFGHGMFTSPLQVARAYAVFANGGMLVQPRLVREPDLGKSRAPVQILNRSTVQTVVKSLLSTGTPPGNALKAQVEGYQIAGKTGTSQVVDSKTKKYSTTHYIGSFVGFAVGVEPKLVIYTQIDRPRGSYYAADTAAPLFREVFLAATHRFGIDSIRTTVASPAPVKQAEPKFADITPAVEIESEQENGKMSWKMPALHGLSAREVLQALKGHPFLVQMKGFGVVKRQVPEKGTKIREGEALRLELGPP